VGMAVGRGIGGVDGAGRRVRSVEGCGWLDGVVGRGIAEEVGGWDRWLSSWSLGGWRAGRVGWLEG